MAVRDIQEARRAQAGTTNPRESRLRHDDERCAGRQVDAQPALPFIVRLAVDALGSASFENEPASEWFLRVEEAVEPGEVIASALDTALGDADHLGLATACEAVAAAELSAACAGHAPDRMPDDVRRWVDGHPHRPHDSEVDQAILAVQRVRADSELRDLWDEDVEGRTDRWLGEIDDLIARLRRSGAGDPATLSP